MCLSVTNCCCCFTLSVGTKIISILCTVISAISLLVYGTAILLYEELPVGRLMFYAAMVVISILQFGFGLLLIVGAFRKKPHFTWPWLLVSWLQAIVLMCLAITGMILLSYNRRVETNAQISAVISVYFVYALVMYYFASVVNSRRQQMFVERRSIQAKRLMRHRVYPDYYV